MYKIIIPPALAIMFASFVAAHVAVKTGDLRLLNYAWGMASFSGLVFISLLAHFFFKGLHHISELEKAEISVKEYERKKDIEKLYSPVSHTDEWLDGFAQASAFLAENYLSGDRPGMTENRWFKMISESKQMGLPEDPALLEISYRTYMIAALMHRNGITFKDYERICQAAGDTPGGMIIGDTPYAPNLIDETIKNWQKSKTAEELKKHRG